MGFVMNDLLAQYTESITSSRPGQAFTPLSVGLNALQVQTGLNLSGFSIDNTPVEGDVINYSALFRYGIKERVEFRTGFGISRVDTESGFSEVMFSGFSSFTVGTKINIINGSGQNPNVGIQADFALPVVDEDFRNDKVATTLILAHTQGLTEAIGLSTNLGAAWDGNDGETAGLYVVNIGFALPGDFGAFIETYGFFDNDDFDILFDGGFSYLVNPNLLLDISGGYGSNDTIDQFFVDFGFSWRTRFGGE